MIYKIFSCGIQNPMSMNITPSHAQRITLQKTENNTTKSRRVTLDASCFF